MHTKALRRQAFPPRNPIRRVRLLAWNVHMGLSPQAAAERLGFTKQELQQALHHADFEVMLADIAAQLAEGIEATNANLVAAATCMLEQLIYQAEPRVLLYLVHCAAEGKNGLLLIAQASIGATEMGLERKLGRRAGSATTTLSINHSLKPTKRPITLMPTSDLVWPAGLWRGARPSGVESGPNHAI